MSKSRIEWTDETWNPVTGCSKVSQGCKNCYAEREWPRMTKLVPAYSGRSFTDVRCHLERLEQPLRWKRPRKVFVNSMSDLFHPDVSDQFIADVFGIMAACPQHTFQILTKRPDRALQLLGSGCMGRFQDDLEECMALYIDAPIVWPLPNVWIGVSVEDQVTANERIPLLLQTPAAVRWISAEPLLGSIDFTGMFANPNNMLDGTNALEAIDWVVVGGESGPNARPMHPQWARNLRDQCAAAGVPFLFKQWGEWVPRSSCYHTFENGQSCADIDPSATKWPCVRRTEAGRNGRDINNSGQGDDAYMQRVGKKRAGRLLDGVQHDGYPEVELGVIR